MSVTDDRNDALILKALRKPGPLLTVELRPPPRGLDHTSSRAAWMDLHHSLGHLTREQLFVFLTDSAVGAAEEESLAYVGTNVDGSVDLRRVIPILTCKHTLEYCESFASRAESHGFDALTVLGGDKSVDPPRCVPHGRDLREILRTRVPGLALGGWANPHRDAAKQAGYITASDSYAEFALSQVVSHHSLQGVAALLEALDRSDTSVPMVFGVFFYRSANPATLATLSQFLPVPARELTKEFESASAEEICARTIRELRSEGAEKVYVSNLGNRGAENRLARILEAV